MTSIVERKAEHLEFAADAAAEVTRSAGWGDIDLVHEALPELDRDEIALETALLGRTLGAPLVIAAMTGGHPGAVEINAVLARAAERHGLAIGAGSQRAALRDPSLEPSYTVLREHAPTAPVYANIGAAQLIPQGGRPPLTGEQVRRVVDMLGADALAIHLNVLEESVQPEGDAAMRGCAAAIGRVAQQLDVPVIVKETGAGMSRETARRLADLGVAALDVGGCGGTSFAIIERLRAERQGDRRGVALGTALAEWGIPTAVAITGAAAAGVPIVGTGGVRSGTDAAKALALGATAVGVARPLLLAAMDGDDAVEAWIDAFLSELRTVLLLSGCREPAQLHQRPLVIHGRTRAWLDDLGYTRARVGEAG